MEPINVIPRIGEEHNVDYGLINSNQVRRKSPMAGCVAKCFVVFAVCGLLGICVWLVTQIFSDFSGSGGRSGRGTCPDTLPSDGDANAVYIEFYTNTQGGAPGSECPSACDSPVAASWYPINDEDTCYTWPGRSGDNSLLNGVCNVDNEAYVWDQWINCKYI